MLRKLVSKAQLRFDEMLENVIRRYFIFGFGK